MIKYGLLNICKKYQCVFERGGLVPSFIEASISVIIICGETKTFNTLCKIDKEDK
jgi:hypothetical protein